MDCNSHRPDKVNHCIHCPNTRVGRACIEESLISAKHGVAHITLVLKIDYSCSHWHIARFSANSAKKCWAMKANTRTLRNAKVGTSKHSTSVSTYKGLKKEYRSTNNVEHEFWFCPNDIKYCVSGNKKKYVLD